VPVLENIKVPQIGRPLYFFDIIVDMAYWSSCGWRKDTFWDKATLNSEEIKIIALAVIELCLSEGIR